MDVVAKEGSLFIQGVKFGKRIWRKTWVILFEPSPTGIGRLEMYDMRDGGSPPKPVGLKKLEKRVVRLADCLSITPAPGESCPTECAAFYLNTAERTYTLAGPKQDEWVPTLCQLAFQRNEGGSDSKRPQQNNDMSMSNNDLYSTWSPGQYQVKVLSSEASVRCCMSGSYLLSPEKDALCLLDLNTGKTAFYWPYRFLRRFGQIKDGITIEAGRRCHTGEGHFTFMSKQGNQIYRAIEEAIMHQSVQDLLSKATSQMQDSTTQQPPPRPLIDDRMKGCQGSPTRGMKDRPCLPLSRRNLALPAPPVPKALPPPPAPPAPPALPAVCTKPLVILSKPPAMSPKPPADTTKEVLYATIKPQPKPRVKTAPPKIPQPPPGPNYSPPEPKQKREEEKETKERYICGSDEDPDSDYCNLRQVVEVQQDSPDTDTIYSLVVPPDRQENKCSMVASQDQTTPMQNSLISSSEIPLDFRQVLSNVLFKDLTRMTPRSYGGSSERLAKLDVEMDDVDYCEIKN
ncbi:docking protein 3 [Pygocentrus nattereri]|uniref:IRS-type PTB domain-containing protein n=1 Tax=Pygocentrus nattereri TaxID=42514 RepID=A0A3B4C5S0_PYGNA|nr:docking protein 3 [Pygocentrus nattereri]